jgi:hypothetical protein
MPRRNSGNSKRINVTREVYALAAVAEHRARLDGREDENLPGKVFGSRRITRAMYRALKGQVA